MIPQTISINLSVPKSFHFDRMRETVRRIHPTLREGQIIYACNKIGNWIRNQRYDLYEITLAGAYISPDHELEVTEVFQVGDVSVYLLAKTD